MDSWAEYLFSFQGRINRARYWQFFALTILAAVALMVVVFGGGAAISAVSPGDKSPLRIAAIIVAALVGFMIFVGFFWASLAIAVKRLHDRNRSGWWILVFQIAPSVLRLIGEGLIGQGVNGTTAVGLVFALGGAGLGIWGFVEIGCLRGTVGSNRFGPDPLGNTDAEMAAVFE